MKNKKNKYERKPKGEENNLLPDNIRNAKKKRECLMCGKMFNSKGVGNRRCPICTRHSGSKTSTINKIHLP